MLEPAPLAARALNGKDLRLAANCMDLTTLHGDDTEARVEKLCETARDPLGSDDAAASVCVFPVFVPIARKALSATAVKVGTVAGGFPHGLSPLKARIDEVRECVELGADEVDVIIRRSHALAGEWSALYDEVAAFREAASSRTLKVILAAGELRDLETIWRASLVTCAAGADFIKTSTGKEAVNATIEAGEAMCAAIRSHAESAGRKVGIKPAGGIRTTQQIGEWISLVEQRLGSKWLQPKLFRIGLSSIPQELIAGLSASR